MRYLWVIIAILIMTGCNATPSDQRKHATPCTNIRTAVKKFPKQVELPTELPFKVDEQSACLINWEGRDYISLNIAYRNHSIPSKVSLVIIDSDSNVLPSGGPIQSISLKSGLQAKHWSNHSAEFLFWEKGDLYYKLIVIGGKNRIDIFTSMI